MKKQIKCLILFTVMILINITQIHAGTLINTTTPWIPNTSGTTVTNSDASVTMTRPNISGYRFLLIRLSQTRKDGALSRDLIAEEKITVKIRAKSSSTKSYIYSKFLDFPLTHFAKANEYRDFIFETTVKSNISPYAWLGLFTSKSGDTVTVQSIEIEAGSNPLIGTRIILPTPLQKGTKFASPDGKGEGLSQNDPSSLQYAMEHLKGGDVLFLRGGVYKFSMNGLKKFRIYKDIDGTKSNPTIIESFPNELAIFDGSMLHRDINTEREQGGILVYGKYSKIRKIEVRNMPEDGIHVEASNVIVEGCVVHHNGLTGIKGHKFSNIYFRDNISHHNSDVGLGKDKWNYNDGGNADGIAISSSKHSIIENNIVYLNSDDGIDIWGSSSTIVQYNKVYRNGYLDNHQHAGIGDGQGIKAGAGNSTDNRISHNLVWKNYSRGIDSSERTNKNLTYSYNTTWKNGHKGNKGRGYTGNKDTKFLKNISSKDTNHLENNNGKIDDNSWNRNDNSWNNMGTVSFINTTDVNSSNFLRPEQDEFLDIGAYAKD